MALRARGAFTWTELNALDVDVYDELVRLLVSEQKK